jgi:hypothetical protein
MRRTLVAVVAAVVCAAPVGAQSVVAVQASNAAGVPAALLTNAQARVGTIFAAAGVPVAWIDDTPAEGARQIRLTLLFVHFTSKQNVGADALGVAIEPPTGIGRVAYVFWDRIREHALTQQRDLEAVLVFVMAHELGHLLLPHYSHATFGVMSDTLTGSVIVEAQRGRLSFSRREAARMRERILRQDAIQQARSDLP